MLLPKLPASFACLEKRCSLYYWFLPMVEVQAFSTKLSVLLRCVKGLRGNAFSEAGKGRKFGGGAIKAQRAAE